MTVTALFRVPPADDEADWRERALCARSSLRPDAWFPPRGADPGADAKAVCTACPVRAECLGYAITRGIREGVWGGLSEGDRRRLRRNWLRRQRSHERGAA
jgi:WhiB family transcriptional regulator, redox-sensing transcriptional regulator